MTKKKKTVLAIVSGAVLIALFSTSLAYLGTTDKTPNLVRVGEDEIKVTEEFTVPDQSQEYAYRKLVKIANTGSIPCYVRVRLEFSNSVVEGAASFTAEGQDSDTAPENGPGVYKKAAVPDNKTDTDYYVNSLPPDWIYVWEPNSGDFVPPVTNGYYYYTEEAVGIKDHALCTIDTLMDYLEDEERYTWETVLPAKFGDEWNEKTLEQWKAAFKEYLKYTYFIIHMGSVTGKEYGIPSLAPNNPAKGAIQFGIEELESNLLGIKDLSVSLRRHKDIIKEFCDKWDEKHIDPMITKALESDGPQSEKYCFDSSMILLSHNILNPKQFDMFLWPSLQRMLDAYAEKNMNVRIFAEGSILRYAEKFNRYPKGTITMHLEQDDPFAFREAAPNCAIMGGLDTELLANGTPEECITRTKKLCDELGRQGGFILSEGKMLSYKNDCKADNLKAICDFVSNYKL